VPGSTDTESATGRHPACIVILRLSLWSNLIFRLVRSPAPGSRSGRDRTPSRSIDEIGLTRNPDDGAIVRSLVDQQLEAEPRGALASELAKA
jgi:hypothetical protein